MTGYMTPMVQYTLFSASLLSTQLPSLPPGCPAEILSLQWLEVCLKEGRLVDTDGYRIT